MALDSLAAQLTSKKFLFQSARCREKGPPRGRAGGGRAVFHPQQSRSGAIFCRRNTGHVDSRGRVVFGYGMRASFFRGALGLAAVVGGMALLAEDWPCFRGPRHDGISRETNWTCDWPASGPPRRWTAEVGTGFSGVSVAAGRAFTMGNRRNHDTVWCLDAESGKTLWRHTYPSKLAPRYYEGGPGATPTVDGERVYTLSKHGRLFCFATADGRVLWEEDLPKRYGVTPPTWGFAGSPFIHNRLLLLNVGGAGMALDKLTGRPVWTSTTNITGYATPVPCRWRKQDVVLLFGARALRGVRVSDGQTLWQFRWKSGWDVNAADPVLWGNRVFISSYDQGGALLDLTPRGPKPLWQHLSMSNQFNACVLLDGFLYGINGNTDIKLKDLRCVEFATGRIAWKHQGPGLGSLIAAGGRLLILSDRGELVVAEPSPQAFRPLARARILSGRCWTAPTLAHGRLYARNSRGRLVCVDLRPPGRR